MIDPIKMQWQEFNFTIIYLYDLIQRMSGCLLSTRLTLILHINLNIDFDNGWGKSTYIPIIISFK